jgi:F-type H+-transporting ATPase subunit a
MINLEYSISDYNPFKILPSNVSIIIVSLLMMVLVVIYYIKLKNNKPSVTPKGYVLCVQLYIKFIENLILQSFGKKSEKISIFFSFLFIYIFLLNTISLFGFASPTSSLTVTFSLALIIFIGIIAIGFKYQRASYLKKFFFSLKILKNKQLSIFINPAKIISEITPLLSLSLRL